MSIVKALYEHLKTKKKYNKLQLLHDVKKEELQEKVIELNEQKKINKMLREKFDAETNKLIEENLELKAQLRKLKKKAKDNTNG